jgi:hypothetical protein
MLIISIVVLFLVFAGGGGYYWSRRRQDLNKTGGIYIDDRYTNMENYYRCCGPCIGCICGMAHLPQETIS